MTDNAQFGDEKLLQQARDLCYAIERLPAGEHQTKLISMASEVSFALQNLQRNGDHFWPVVVLPRCCQCGGWIKQQQGGMCMACVGEHDL